MTPAQLPYLKVIYASEWYKDGTMAAVIELPPRGWPPLLVNYNKIIPLYAGISLEF